MIVISNIGKGILQRWYSAHKVTSVIWGVLSLSIRKCYWPRTVRKQLAKQIIFTGVDAVSLVGVIAFFTGVSIVAQSQVWLLRFGQSGMLGSILVVVLIREVGPLLVCFLVIGRSGTAITTELANMRIRNEIDVLDAQGIEPMVYIVLPRIMGIVVSIFCLTIIFITVSLFSGYLIGLLLGVTSLDPVSFSQIVFRAVLPGDIFTLIAKTIVPGFIIGAISSVEGLSVNTSITEVPQAVTRFVVRSIASVVFFSAIISFITYA